ncbi:MAG: general secretion pathway protein GspK [Sphingomonadaceae bacterium]
MRKPRPSRERGAALFAVLAMILVLAGFASLGLGRLKATTDRVSDAEALSEARLMANAGGAAALALVASLKARARNSGGSFGDPIGLPVEGGTVRLSFRDAGACFNLNSLAAPPRSAGDAGTGALAQARPQDFARLLAAAGIPLLDADRLARATAERLSATGLLWADASEWTSVPGVTLAHWRLAAPLLCALPNREAAAINVNSLGPEQAPLLVAMGLAPDEARRALAAKPPGGWTSGNQFWGEASASGTPETAAAQLLGASSRWIALDIEAETPRARVARTLILDTQRAPARVVASRWTESAVKT